MNKYNKIDINDFLNAVKQYETNLGFEKIEQQNQGNHSLFVMDGRRKKRLLIVSQQSFIYNHIRDLCTTIDSCLKSIDNVSDVIDVFSDNDVSPSSRNDINSIGNDLQVSFKIYDRMDLLNNPSFEYLFVSNRDKENDENHALYEYLSMGADSSFIKNSLKYTIILFAINSNPGITIQKLKDEISLLSSDRGTIDADISYLRSSGKIKPKRLMADPNKLELTDKEKERVSNAIRYCNETESNFNVEFSEILKKYQVPDDTNLFGSLKQLYKQYYNWKEDGEKTKKYTTERIDNFIIEAFKREVERVIPDKTALNNAIEDIKNLCTKNPYLTRITLSNSFLDLYRSNKYEEFINDKTNYVLFDTPVFVYFVLVKSYLNEKYGDFFDDDRFRTVKNLIDYKERQSNISFEVPYDYIGEAVGEYQKALKLSEFDRMPNFPIEIQSANSFFNYYIAVKDEKSQSGEDVTNYWFEDFASEFGFPSVSLENVNFTNDISTWFRKYAETLNCEAIPFLSERYECFDEVKKEYEAPLKNKTDNAVKCDVRQGFYITEESQKPENLNVDYYLATWDVSLHELRDIIKKRKGVPRSYSVKTPNKILNAISIKAFNVDPKIVTNDIFAYADLRYSLTDKIRSLFDNVLAPYFSGTINKNSSLVIALTRMQNNMIGNSNDEDNDASRVLPLEDIFLKIEKELTENSISLSDLRRYLCGEQYQEDVLGQFEKAFASYEKGEPIDISDAICLGVKNMLSKEDLDTEEDVV